MQSDGDAAFRGERCYRSGTQYGLVSTAQPATEQRPSTPPNDDTVRGRGIAWQRLKDKTGPPVGEARVENFVVEGGLTGLAQTASSPGYGWVC